jgi:diaminopimelate decarboxylase
MERSDLLAIFTAGAYGMSMASRYNSHPLPAELMVDGTSARVVRRRETVDDLMAHEDPVGAPIAAPSAAVGIPPHAEAVRQ